MLVVFDVGGTKMRVAASRNGKDLNDEPYKLPTPDSYEDGLAQLITMIQKVSKGERITAVGGGIPAVISRDKTTLVHVQNIPSWTGKSFARDLSRALGCRVYIENDTAMVGFGELQLTNFNRSGIAAYITVSTGVGGARFVDGVIDETALGFEPGHHIIDVSTGASLEGLVSGTALKARTGQDPRDISHGDQIWVTLARELAVGIHNVTVFWSPDIIILGGSMMVGDPAIPFELVKKELQKIMKVFPYLPKIELAKLEDDGGLHGSLAYLNQNLDSGIMLNHEMDNNDSNNS